MWYKSRCSCTCSLPGCMPQAWLRLPVEAMFSNASMIGADHQLFACCGPQGGAHQPLWRPQHCPHFQSTKSSAGAGSSKQHSQTLARAADEQRTARLSRSGALLAAALAEATTQAALVVDRYALRSASGDLVSFGLPREPV